MTVIFLIASITLFLTIDWIFRKISLGKINPSTANSIEHSNTIYAPLRVPEGVFFSKSHIWCSLFPSGKVQLGMDDFITSIIEKPKITLLKNVSDKIKKGEAFATLNFGSKFVTVYSPLTGIILETNPRLVEHPEIIRSAKFLDGWMYTIKPNSFSELKYFILGSDSKKWMMTEISRLRDFVTGFYYNTSVLTATLPDGGLPIPKIINTMENETLKKFEEQFLHEKDYEIL